MSFFNCIEREFEGLRPDIVLMTPGGDGPIYRYVERLMQALGEPVIVLFTHWDKHGLPYGALQDEGIKAMTSYGEKLKKVYPKSTFRVLKHFETFTP